MSRKKPAAMTVIHTEEIPALTLNELCEICGVSVAFIEELINYGIIEPISNVDEMYFGETALRRVRTILRLQKDLDINMAGAVLVVDLMEEMEDLRLKLEVVEKYFGHV